MPSLNSILTIAGDSLNVQQGALDVTTNNIANSNTAGYSREVVNLSESSPISNGGIQYGTGVMLQGFTSVRDEVLQSQIYDQTSQENGSLAQTNALSQAETAFSNTTSNISTDITDFFNSVSELSTSPSDPSLRSTVLSDANNIANSFNSTAATLSQLQTSLNATVPKTVDSINQLTKQIASLNQQVSSATQSGQDAGTLKDQQEQLITKLAALTDVQITHTTNGDTVTTGNGTPLVVGDKSFALSTSVNSAGNTEVTANGQDITSSITGGTLGGTLQVRDTTLATMQSKLNEFASQFANAVNTANKAGYDLTGAQGGAIFSTSGTAGAASSIQVAITSGSQIAASSDGTTGSSGNVSTLLAVKNATLSSGMTPVDAYSDLVYTVGNASSQAQSANTAATTTLTQLQSQRASTSGVSIDEETTNMIRYQQAYQAAAKIISTVNSMYSTLMSMTQS